ncbi:asparaginase domain-containing protein [Reichenbachiella versicolor]|uniref:asparaginase domain-containing protein n=1 Tax=Reichenbachiella versicolor TaxID=1821036 RepID=UPI000D6DEC03|nr:asparaginase domain-containing protein [Reichenbachiella versicolor]
MSIKVIETGGTIAKEYNPIQGTLDFSSSRLKEMLERCRVTKEYVLDSTKHVDSLDMTEEDRNEIANKCKTCSESQILISHGTDTIVQTANVIANLRLDKTIVLFGAMIPYKVVNSDALFNLGFALSCVQTLPASVYIAMNGEIFHHHQVKKNTEKGIFELVF